MAIVERQGDGGKEGEKREQETVNIREAVVPKPVADITDDAERRTGGCSWCTVHYYNFTQQ